MLQQKLALFTAMAPFAVAQNTTIYRDTNAVGSPYGAFTGDSGTEEGYQRFAEANSNPNVTKSFQFAPFYLDGVFSNGANSPDLENEWTLSINVTDFAAPDAVQPYPSEQPPLVNPHITNTVLDFQWPQGDNLRSALNGSTAPFCISMTTASFLPNVTNEFTEDNDGADCTPILGEECINAIMFSGSDLFSCSYDSWSDLPECASTLGASRSYAGYGLSQTSWDINSRNYTNNATYADVGYESIANGTDGRFAFYSQSTPAYNATNTTIYDEAANRLHVVLVSISPYQGQSGLVSHKALCMRANATQLDVPEEESSSGGGGRGQGGGEGGSDDSSENVASTLIPSADMLTGALSLAGLMYALL